MTLLITGGAGFIGSAVIRYLIRHTEVRVVNVDKLTYAGNLESLAEVSASPRYVFERVDICNRDELERVTLGEVFDVAVDLRRSSPTFGQWVGEYLSAENHRMLWIPPGFAHGFYTTSEVAEFQYKCTAYYAPESERCIRWDDERIGVEWPLKEEPLVSGKDREGCSLVRAELP